MLKVDMFSTFVLITEHNRADIDIIELNLHQQLQQIGALPIFRLQPPHADNLAHWFSQLWQNDIFDVDVGRRETGKYLSEGRYLVCQPQNVLKIVSNGDQEQLHILKLHRFLC